jgi:RNA polymerase sigma-70 factor (ECF subfamily)
MTPGQTPPLLRFIRKVGAAESDADLTDSHLLARFAAARDEAAFAALVRRHGQMVLGVCRRVLADAHAAEDAFQATFLVLVRKAASIGRPDRLANWLYGVAYRTSLKSRSGEARRRGTELRADAAPGTAPAADDEAARRELYLVLDDELSRLPEKYRTPLLFCCLQGHTHEDAARRLGCPRETLTTRLVRARALLRRRLTRRGIAWASACWTAGTLPDAGAAVPPLLIESTTKAASVFAAGPVAVAGSVSAPAVRLAQGVLHAMFLAKVKLAAALICASGLASAAAVLCTRPTLAERPAERKSEAAPKEADKNEKENEDKAKEDKKKLQGTWDIVSVERDGQDLTAKFNEVKFIFAGDEITIKGGKELKGEFKLNASVTPRQIDIVPTDNKDRTMEGIYEFKGTAANRKDHELKLCLHDAKQRPTEFATKEGSALLLVVLKREKQ